MRKLAFCFFMILGCHSLLSQNSNIAKADSLLQKLQTTSDNKIKTDIYNSLFAIYRNVDTEKANLVKSGLQLRQTYLDPKTTEDQRGTITSLYQAEQGVKPRDTTTVQPGQKISTLENGRIVEKVTNPVIVDEASGTFKEAKPTQTFAKETPATTQRLVDAVGTPKQKEYEDEYVKTFGKLPKGYTGK